MGHKIQLQEIHRKIDRVSPGKFEASAGFRYFLIRKAFSTHGEGILRKRTAGENKPKNGCNA
jgi:hypothetical protein